MRNASFLLLLLLVGHASGQISCIDCAQKKVITPNSLIQRMYYHGDMLNQYPMIETMALETCTRLSLGNMGLARAVTNDTIHIGISFKALDSVLKSTIYFIPIIVRQVYNSSLTRVRERDTILAELTFLHGLISAAPNPAWTVVDVRKFLPYPLKPVTGTGIMPQIPEQALAPLAPDSLGSATREGWVLDANRRPMPGALAYSTAMAGMAVADPNGYFQLRASRSISPDSIYIINYKCSNEYHCNNMLYIFYDKNHVSDKISYGTFVNSLVFGPWDNALRPARLQPWRGGDPVVSYWDLTIQSENRQARGVLATFDSSSHPTSVYQLFANRQVGVWQVWGDSLLWLQQAKAMLNRTFIHDKSNVLVAGYSAPLPLPSWKVKISSVYWSGLYPGMVVSVSDTAPNLLTTGRKPLSAMQEAYYLAERKYPLDRYDLLLTYRLQYDSLHQQAYTQTDSITWHYQPIGTYNWPSVFHLTSVRTALNADGSPGCTDTLRADMRLLHLQRDLPSVAERAQLVPLWLFSSPFPPVNEAFRRRCNIK